MRQALDYALDRDPIVEAIVGDYGRATSQLQADYADPELDDAYPVDPDRAQLLLVEAGYADGFTLDVVDPGNLVGPWGSITMQAVAEDWEEIGIEVNVTSATTTSSRKSLRRPDPELESLFQQASTPQGDEAAHLWRQYNAEVSEQALNVPVCQYQVTGA